MKKRCVLAVFLLSLVAPRLGTSDEDSAQKEPDATQLPRIEEEVVVTASRMEQALVDAPATVSVLSGMTLASAPTNNIGEALRSVPGLNVAQLSAREFNVNGRSATGVLPNSQLVLLDGRSIYLDFFGLVLWDFVPADTSEIRRIEVVRGPASVVWGANAMTGVVNILTRSPRESQGGSLRLSSGFFGRNAGTTAGSPPGWQYGASLRYARALNERWSCKLSGGYFGSDALPRPAGRVPISEHPLIPGRNVGGGIYSDFGNQGTGQPKIDARVDRELGENERLTYAMGFAGTQGIVHTGIGPFAMSKGAAMGYARLAYSRGARRVNGFVNLVDVEARSLQAVDAVSGEPVRLDFVTRTFDLELGDALPLGRHNVLSFGGNVRHNSFKITLAPEARNRTELGLYAHDELFLGRFRLAAGARVDKFGNLPDPVISSRLMVMFKPIRYQSLRLSFNKAFRSPSAVNNYMDLTITGVEMPPQTTCWLAPDLCRAAPVFSTTVLRLGPRALGSETARAINSDLHALQPDSLSAFELAYSGAFSRRMTAGLALYWNRTEDNINFVADEETVAAAGLPIRYSSQYPPQAWPADPALVDDPALRASLFDMIPASVVYLNIGPIRDRGLETWLEYAMGKGFRASVNYSWQETPKPLLPQNGQAAFPSSEIQIPAKHRLNLTLDWEGPRLVGGLQVHSVPRTFWNDVLTTLGFEGWTDAYALVNASLGVRWREGKLTTMLKAKNLLDRDVRQHLFGDIIKRSFTAEMRFEF